jgi:hypothetical protein
VCVSVAASKNSFFGVFENSAQPENFAAQFKSGFFFKSVVLFYLHIVKCKKWAVSFYSIGVNVAIKLFLSYAVMLRENKLERLSL